MTELEALRDEIAALRREVAELRKGVYGAAQPQPYVPLTYPPGPQAPAVTLPGWPYTTSAGEMIGVVDTSIRMYNGTPS